MKQPIELNYLGHSAFTLSRGDVSILLDPFITGNSWNVIKAEELTPKYILISHAHWDHLGDTQSIAKRSEALVVTTSEISKSLKEQGCNVHPMHIGGKKEFEFGSVRVTPALHGSGIAGGFAAGFVIDFYGVKVYFAGDTALFGDMSLIGQRDNIDYAILPIGDNYTMGIEDAVAATKLLGPRHVIPMHYNTNEYIRQSPEKFKEMAETETGINVIIVKPGSVYVIQSAT